jgi:phosphoribosylanthranilate isomerase
LSKGTDYIGLIFAESERRVEVARALEIRDAVPDAMIVGVFLDAPVTDVVKTAAMARLDLIQLHGSESPGYCAEVYARTSKPIIKAFPVNDLPDTAMLSAYDTTSFFMFDLSKSVAVQDTSARSLDAMWGHVSRKRAQGFRVFLAGALDDSNVRAAIDQTQVYCVDVCRGVERSPGVKDRAAVERFIAEVKS